ncbi:siderophore ABC transporter substrate-binding protein [Peribacillus sp. SCS-37]|uniref:siderophore ABC transporter substrate-binding protein n=1 Tax=Paraperibacillus esterisolvens TaxID=3115296 RepID=UPI00390628F5
MKNWKLFTLLFTLILLLAACGEESQKETAAEAKKDKGSTITIKHQYGEVKVPANPDKAVVFDFGTLDTMDELGIEPAGLPQMTIPGYLSKYESKKYKNTGSLKEPDFEAISSMEPDVIFISGRQAEMYEEFSKIAPTVFVELDSKNYMKSFEKNVSLIAEIYGKEKEAEAKLADIQKSAEELKTEASSLDKKALVILANEGKISAYGQGSRFGIIHDLFGFKAADEQIEVSTHGQNISNEYILEKNPDILFVIDRTAAVGGSTSAKETVENEITKKTAAFKEGKIIYLDPDYWYLSGGGLQSVKAMADEVQKAL